MDRKQMCVSNVRYKKPTQNEAKRMKNLLGYLTYRDSRDDYMPQVSGVERWVDHGMGKSVTQIADTCEGYQSDHVLLFSLIVNPNPDLIRMVPHEEREAFVKQLTEHTVEGFFDARGIFCRQYVAGTDRAGACRSLVARSEPEADRGLGLSGCPGGRSCFSCDLSAGTGRPGVYE